MHIYIIYKICLLHNISLSSNIFSSFYPYPSYFKIMLMNIHKISRRGLQISEFRNYSIHDTSEGLHGSIYLRCQPLQEISNE